MNTKFFLFAAAAMSLVACNSNDAIETIANNNDEIRLFTEVAGATRAADVAADLQDVQFKSGATLSVKVTENATSVTADYALATYTCDGSGGLALPEGTKQYYPASGNGVNIYAFHPAGTPAAFAVTADQSTPAAYIASDLMWASLSNITRESEDAARTLTFTHKLSKIIVTLTAGTGIDATELAAATVTVGTDEDKVILNGTFTAATGEFATATGDAISSGIITLTTAAASTANAAIIVPQSMAGKKINVTIGSTTKSYTIPDETTFAAAKKYSFALTVTNNGTDAELTLTGTSITDWGTADGWTDPAAGQVDF